MRRLNQKSMLSKAAVCFLLLLLFSCSRYTTNTRSVSDFSALSNIVSDRYKLVSSNIIKMKFSTVVRHEGKDNKLSGKILITTDTCVFINVISSSLGIEVAQIRFTNDSVLFVNKMDKNYYSGSYNDFVKLVDVNYKSVFSILTNSYIRSDSIDFNSNKAFYFAEVKRFMVNDLYLYDGLKSYVTTEFNQYGSVDKIEFKSARSNFLRVNYSNFANNFSFPETISLSTTIKKEKVSLDLKINSVEFLKEERAVVKISSLNNYSRISL